MLKVICKRRIWSRPFVWTMNVNIFTNTDLCVDIDDVSPELLIFIHNAVRQEEFLAKKDDIFGNNVTLSNFCNDEEIQQISESKMAPFLLLLRIMLLESLRSDDPLNQRTRISKAVEDVLSREQRLQEPYNDLLPLIKSHNYRHQTTENILSKFFN